MHHFSSHTYATLSCDVAQQDVWRGPIVRMAFDCNYLLKAILAVSALHLAKLWPEKRATYLSTAFSYYETALTSAIPLMSDLKEEDARNLFVFSSLTIFFGTASPLFKQTI